MKTEHHPVARNRSVVDRRTLKPAARNAGNPPQSPIRLWVYVVTHKRFRALFAHPHHYVTACMLSVFLYATGHGETGGILAAFGYAIFENLVSASEE